MKSWTSVVSAPTQEKKLNFKYNLKDLLLLITILLMLVAPSHSKFAFVTYPLAN